MCATCHRTQVAKTERAVAHMPVREGKMSCSSCHNPHGSISNVKALKVGSSVAELCIELSHRDARTDALRARAGARELRDLPRSARILQRPDARGPHADALPALSHREQAPGDALRQGPDHHQQEQPDVRQIVRELPLERPRLESPLGPVLHAVSGAVVCADSPSRRSPCSASPRPVPHSHREPPNRRRRHRLRRRRSRRRSRPRPRRPTPRRAADASRSLFEPTAREFLIGGRFTSVDGDPARYQRYQDQRDGLLFSNFRYSFAKPDGTWDFHARAENVGYRDQEFMGSYDRIGKLSLSGSWQQIPQFYSVDTMTPYTGTGGTLVLDDATQRAIQNGVRPSSTPTSRWRRQFDLRERRDIGRVDMVATPKPNLDVTASFTTQKHSGELPWGASFGFSNDVEVALPYDSRTNDLTIGTEWTNARNMLRVAYSGSWFDNIAPTLIWDSPLRLDDASGAPGRGRMSLWPSNSAQTISFGGYTKLAHKTQVTGSFSYGLWSNDEPLQPFTINSALPQIALPRANTEGEAHVFSTNLSLTSHPSTDWRFSARVRNYTYDNLMPATSHHGHDQLRLARSRRRPRAVRTSTRTAGRTSTATPRGRN